MLRVKFVSNENGALCQKVAFVSKKSGDFVYTILTTIYFVKLFDTPFDTKFFWLK